MRPYLFIFRDLAVFALAVLAGCIVLVVLADYFGG